MRSGFRFSWCYLVNWLDTSPDVLIVAQTPPKRSTAEQSHETTACNCSLTASSYSSSSGKSNKFAFSYKRLFEWLLLLLLRNFINGLNQHRGLNWFVSLSALVALLCWLCTKINSLKLERNRRRVHNAVTISRCRRCRCRRIDGARTTQRDPSLSNCTKDKGRWVFIIKGGGACSSAEIASSSCSSSFSLYVFITTSFNETTDYYCRRPVVQMNEKKLTPPFICSLLRL